MLLSLFSSLFCQTPFAGLLLRQGDRSENCFAENVRDSRANRESIRANRPTKTQRMEALVVFCSLEWKSWISTGTQGRSFSAQGHASQQAKAPQKDYVFLLAALLFSLMVPSALSPYLRLTHNTF